ncbi:hypothetical protein [Streptomyces sp. NPDC058335]|uniref:hypothetical protein n=1 Tax=Streptomyces sp. NPDC058335 TaxID=3346451 RepID=UPI003656BCEB
MSSSLIRATGNVTSAVVNRYRPVGVVRTGSAEDRAQSYRRFLDATTQVGLNATWFHGIKNDGGKSAEPFLLDLLPRLTQSGNELACAVQGVRLCAPAFVIEAAEAVAEAIPDLALDKQDFGKANKEFVRTQAAFLEAARHDLDYDPKWYSMLAKRRESLFRKRRTARGVES